MKSSLPFDGDWLFSSTRSCAKHRDAREGEHDLDLDFESFEQSLQAFHGVVEPEGRKLLYEHARDELEGSRKKQDTTRDKAKQLLGFTSVTLALISASVIFLKDWRSVVSGWAIFLILVLFFWVISHFWRALVLSIRAVTREELASVPTQRVVSAISGDKQDFENGKVYLNLAADLRSAATATNRRVLERVNRVILAQESFRWGLVLLPFPFIIYAAVVLSSGKGSSTPVANDSEVETRQLRIDVDHLRAAIKQKLDLLDSRTETVDAKIDGLKTTLENVVKERGNDVRKDP